MSFKNLSMTKKFTLLGSLLVVSCIAITAFACLWQVRSDLVKQAQVTLDNRLKVFWELLLTKDTSLSPNARLEDKMRSANIRIESDKLLISFYALNDDVVIVDQVKNLFGGVATIFMKDVRASTSLANPDGSRALGSKLQGPAYDAVMKKGQAYRGEVILNGRPFFSAYDPIKDKEGKVIGAIGVALPKSDYFATFNRIILIISIIAACLIVAINVFLFGFIRKIMGPLRQLIPVASSLAEGDLSIRIETQRNDEIGQLLSAMKNMIERWRSVVADVQQASGNVASAGQKLNENAGQMSTLSTEQEQRSSQVATAAEEMSQTIMDIAQNVNNIAGAAQVTLAVAKDGQGIVDKSVTEVKEIAETVDASSEFVRSLGDRSRQIGEIVDVIGDIADQTNLLALNAAIEAARAGEQGRGFAVVADEVRKLAERTANATSEISAMIKTIQEEVFKAVDSMENASGKVTVGVELSAHAGEALKNIVEKADELQLMVQQIASATEEMSTTSEEITKDIGQIASASRETSESSSHTTQAAAELSRLSINLQKTVGEFKLEAQEIQL
ncbi:MAG: methyl-accepting chemotaxis protein [Syntrophorhabdaceae bacterium]|nr:methyl-accepting chemotaxis protein [Syntrophorhabdaceae bacterium]